MKFAVLQMNSGPDVAANLKQLEQLLRSAHEQGVELAVLPENFALMGEDKAARLAIAEPAGSGPLQDCLVRLSRDLGMWLVGGTIPLVAADPERPYSACCVYNSAGILVGRYNKIHLFDVQVPGAANTPASETYGESTFTSAGSETLVVKTPWGRLGVAVCYDLRFPELFRKMLASGLDLLAIPAAFTVATGQAHWEVLLRARAVENLVYVAAAAQTGEHPAGRRTWGHAMIVDPWGKVLADAGTEPGLIVAEFDAARMRNLRQEFPVLLHRREQTD